MSVLIRRARPADAPTIADFNARMAWETEQKRLDPALVGPGVARVFESEGRGFYLVAERSGEVVGQLMVTYEWSDWRNGWAWWVQSVYVREDCRRLGVFRLMYQEVVQQAKAAGNVVGIRLYVERANVRAQATYQQLGMHDAGYLVYEQMFVDPAQPAG